MGRGWSVLLICVRVVAFWGPDCEVPVRKQPADCLRWCHREVWWRVCTNSAVRSVIAHPSWTWPVTGLSPSPQLRPMWTDSWSPLYLKLRSSDRWDPSGRAANVRPLPCTFWNSRSEARDPGYCLSLFRFDCWLAGHARVYWISAMFSGCVSPKALQMRCKGRK